MNFEETAKLWMAEKTKQVKRSTLSAYTLCLHRCLLPVFGQLTEVTGRQVQEYIDGKISQGIGVKTVKDHIIVLKMILRWGAARGYFPPLPFWELVYPKAYKDAAVPVLALEHQRKLEKYLSENFSFPNLGLLLCLHSGLRIGELCGLKWSDFDMTEKTLTVQRTVERIYNVLPSGDKGTTELVVGFPKTVSSFRRVPLSKVLVQMVKPLQKMCNPEFYVIANGPSPYEPRRYRNHFSEICKRLDIPRIRFHGLRHTFATRLIEAKVDVKTVSVLLGHSDISTTMNTYVHPDRDQKENAINAMLKRVKSFQS